MIQVDIVTVLKQLLSNFNVEVKTIKKPYEELETFDYGLKDGIMVDFNRSKIIKLFTNSLMMNTLTVLEDFIGVQYVIFPYPNNLNCFIMIGPYRYKSYDAFEAKKWKVDELGSEAVQLLRNYYLNVPFVPEDLINVHVTAIISTIYPKNKFNIKYVTEFTPFNVISGSLSVVSEQKNKSMEIIESTYKQEEKIFDAISAGNASLALQLLRSYNSPNLEKRFYQSLRTMKNSLIILNTMMRKAIQKSHVHPYYIDEISSKYSLKIEMITDEKEYLELIQVMITDYCGYVHKYSLR